MTGKQRAFLRSLANAVPAKYQIGKSGIEDGTLDMIREALEANEIVKIHVLDTAMADKREVCRELCDILSAEPVQVIGNKIVLYKQSRKNKTIDLRTLTVRKKQEL